MTSTVYEEEKYHPHADVRPSWPNFHFVSVVLHNENLAIMALQVHDEFSVKYPSRYLDILYVYRSLYFVFIM